MIHQATLVVVVEYKWQEEIRDQWVIKNKILGQEFEMNIEREGQDNI